MRERLLVTLVVGLVAVGLAVTGCKKSAEAPAPSKAKTEKAPAKEVMTSAPAAAEKTPAKEPVAKKATTGAATAPAKEPAAKTAATVAAVEKTAYPYINKKCPITGNAIDAAKTTADLVKEWKGVKVAFCCGDCPPVWEKLTDKEKLAKLAAASPAGELPKVE